MSLQLHRTPDHSQRPHFPRDQRSAQNSSHHALCPNNHSCDWHYCQSVNGEPLQSRSRSWPSNNCEVRSRGGYSVQVLSAIPVRTGQGDLAGGNLTHAA
jgi:hypothetical protein